MYHRVLPSADPRAASEEAGMMVTPESFALHMSLLKQYFQPVQLSRWLHDKAEGNPLPSRACAITFDDGWADNFEFAYPVLKQLQIPATIFLVADMIGKAQVFWPERLAELLHNAADQQRLSDPALDWLRRSSGVELERITLTQDTLSRLISTCKEQSDEAMNQQLDRCEQMLALETDVASPRVQPPALLDWQQVNQMRDSNLIEFGSHTCQHTRLTSDKTDDILRHEIIDSKSLIEQHTGQDVVSFCYPNGDYSDAAQRLVRQHYLGAVTTARGWNTTETDNHLLSRIGVHEDIADDRIGFLARVSGWV